MTLRIYDTTVLEAWIRQAELRVEYTRLAREQTARWRVVKRARLGREQRGHEQAQRAHEAALVRLRMEDQANGRVRL